MSSANAEQLPAIHHSGGVLLKAGAGSGKTFVLVEHVLHLTRQWRDEWLQDQRESFADFLNRKYAATVLMTFTKLAAGLPVALRFLAHPPRREDARGPHGGPPEGRDEGRRVPGESSEG